VVQLHLRLPTAEYDTASITRALTSVMVSAQVDRDCGRAQLTVDAESRNTLVYVEEWFDLEHLEVRIRSEQFGVLLAVMETCPTPPVLEFRFLSETRGLDFVAEVRNVEPRTNTGEV
jgi:hypothetical protein